MTADQRAAELYLLLREIGFRALVMGGHAVRYYGLDRRTIDFDFQLAIEPWQWSELAKQLSSSKRFSALQEGSSWRPDDFRRFVIGSLPDGREERLEFWRTNHLLPAFEDAWTRREEGSYGGQILAFLGLDDLIRSKETERDEDWRDIRVLEEFADERRIHRANESSAVIEALSALRSRRGFELALQRKLFDDRRLASEALSRARTPISRAYLMPFREAAVETEAADILWRALASVPPGSAKHLALVEAVRNRYRQSAAAADRADKERVRVGQSKAT